MNIINESLDLPRRSQIALIGHLLRAARPTIKELAHATGNDYGTVQAWLTKIERNFPVKSP